MPKTSLATGIISGAHIRQLELPSYRNGDLHVLCRAAGTDTRRLSHIMDSASYKAYIHESYGSDFEAGRDAHLTELSRNLGRNIRAVFVLRLTVNVRSHNEDHPNTAVNLSPTGAMFDSTALIPAEDREGVSAIFLLWFFNLFKVARCAGLSQEQFIGNGKYLESFLHGFSGKNNKIPEPALSAIRQLPEAQLFAQIFWDCFNAIRQT